MGLQAMRMETDWKMIGRKSKRNKDMPPSVERFLNAQIACDDEQEKKPLRDRNLYPISIHGNSVTSCLWEVFFPNEYITAPIDPEQVNTIFLHRMLMKYCRLYRKAIKKRRQQHA